MSTVLTTLEHASLAAELEARLQFEPLLAELSTKLIILAGMRERVHLDGGELDVETTPVPGTTVLAWVPIQKR